jgi:predicted dehydrogenase
MSDHGRPLGLGIVGCGNIMAAYMTGLTRAAGVVRIARFSDVDPARAEAAVTEYGVGRAGTLDELLADPEVDMIVSLTPPTIHDDVIVKAAAAGKHVFTEKPLSATLARARAAMAAADRAGVKVGCAPDTFLGPVHQATRAAIDAGEIGDPIGYNSFSCYRRAEERHPNPGFLFAAGGGPVLDLGPYYISTFVNLFGPIALVSAATRVGVPVRHARRADGSTLDIPVSVPTHASATLVHTSGVIGTFVASFDMWEPTKLPDLEIYGSEGTLESGHPAWFDGDVLVRGHQDGDWRLLPNALPDIQPGRARFPMTRGLGVVDLAESLSGRPNRPSSELALHALEVLEAIQRASDEATTISISSAPQRPAPLTRADLARWFGEG